MSQRDLIFSIIPLLFLQGKLSVLPWAICPSDDLFFSFFLVKQNHAVCVHIMRCIIPQNTDPHNKLSSSTFRKHFVFLACSQHVKCNLRLEQSSIKSSLVLQLYCFKKQRGKKKKLECPTLDNSLHRESGMKLRILIQTFKKLQTNHAYLKGLYVIQSEDYSQRLCYCSMLELSYAFRKRTGSLITKQSQDEY